MWTKTSSVMPSIPYIKYISSVNIGQWWKSLIKWSIVNRLLDTKQIIVVIIYWNITIISIKLRERFMEY